MSEKNKVPIKPLKPGDKVPEEYRKLLKLGDYSDEMIAKEKTAILKSFNDIFKEDGVCTTYVPELDCNIKYKPLTVGDIKELDAIEDDTERGDETLFRYWSRGGSDIKKDSYNDLAIWKKNAILAAIVRKTPFLGLNLPEDSAEEDSLEIQK